MTNPNCTTADIRELQMQRDALGIEIRIKSLMSRMSGSLHLSANLLFLLGLLNRMQKKYPVSFFKNCCACPDACSCKSLQMERHLTETSVPALLKVIRSGQLPLLWIFDAAYTKLLNDMQNRLMFIDMMLGDEDEDVGMPIPGFRDCATHEEDKAWKNLH